MKNSQLNLHVTTSCHLLLSHFILSMLPEIVSVYTKVLSGGCSLTFLHDSVHCPHCLNGGIHIVPKNKDQSITTDHTPTEKVASTAPPESLIREARLRGLIVRHDSIPESCFSPLGIKVTAAVVAQLKIKHPKLPQRTKDQICKRSVPKRHCKNILGEKIKNSCLQFTKNEKQKKCVKTQSTKDAQKSLCKSILSRVETKVSVKDKHKPGPSKKPKASKLSKVNKEPTKGTLKRKRWQLNRLKKNDEDYEDDLFEDTKFRKFSGMLEEDSDSDKYEGMSTPRISISPVRDGSSSPSYEDCYSPSELFITRKEAEEYIFRREKRRKLKLQDQATESEESPEKNSEEYIKKTLEQTCRILSESVPKDEDCDSDEAEDYYFSDVSDDSKT